MMNPASLAMTGRGSSYRKGRADDMPCAHARHLPTSDRLDELQ
nr:MAG TPA: hypothetical protein [Caudoviricetes sp.]